MGDAEIAAIWGLIAVVGFAAAGMGLIEGLYVGVAALIALGLVFVAPAWLGALVFAGLLLIAIPLTRMLVARTRYDGAMPDGARDGIAGRPGVVVAPIEGTAAEGRIRVGGRELPATVAFTHHAPVRLGTRVLVDRVEGATAIVTPEAALRERVTRGELTSEQLDELLDEAAG